MSIENIKALIQCLYAIAGVVSIVGLFDIYVTMNNDAKSVWKPVARIIATTVALYSIAAALESVYLN